MNELSDREIIDIIANHLIGEIGEPSKVSESKEFLFFSDIYTFDTEIGSGSSFSQYFHWANKRQIDNITDQLKILKLDKLIPVITKAIDIAFPNGVPENIHQFDELTDWSKTQEEALSQLYFQESTIHTLIEKALGSYVREKELLSIIR